MRKYQIAYHPGEQVAEELKARGRTQSFFAHLIGKSPTEVNYICKCKRDITVDMAIRMGIAFGTSTEVWLHLQGAYDIYKMWEKNEKIYNKIAKSLPH